MFSVKYVFFASCFLNDSSFRKDSAYGAIWGAEESNLTEYFLMFNVAHWYTVTVEYERTKDVKKIIGHLNIPPHVRRTSPIQLLKN